MTWLFSATLILRLPPARGIGTVSKLDDVMMLEPTLPPRVSIDDPPPKSPIICGEAPLKFELEAIELWESAELLNSALLDSLKLKA